MVVDMVHHTLPVVVTLPVPDALEAMVSILPAAVILVPQNNQALIPVL